MYTNFTFSYYIESKEAYVLKSEITVFEDKVGLLFFFFFSISVPMNLTYAFEMRNASMLNIGYVYNSPRNVILYITFMQIT